MVRLNLFVTSLLLTVALVSPLQAEEGLKIGDTAPDWAALEGADGKLHSLADFKDKDALVVVFTCVSCPYAVDAEEPIMKFCKEYCGEGKKTALVAINSNAVKATNKEDSLDAMKERAKKFGFNFPYLRDESQQVARAYDAQRTPEFYVFDADRKLVYRGAMLDDSDPAKAKVNYVAEAVAAVLAGGVPKVQETTPVGCLVRYERKRRGEK